jgi:hypothetical protein
LNCLSREQRQDVSSLYVRNMNTPVSVSARNPSDWNLCFDGGIVQDFDSGEVIGMLSGWRPGENWVYAVDLLLLLNDPNLKRMLEL